MDSKPWTNEILHTKQGLHYTRESDAIIDKIGRYWLRVMHCGGPIDKIANYTVFLALHLRAPTVEMEYIFDVKFQRPTLQDNVHPVTGIKMDEPITADTKGLDMLSLFTLKLFPVPELENLANDEEIEKLKFAAENINVSANNKMKALEGKLHDLMTDKQRAAFYAFLAAVTCRLTSKDPYYMKKEWESQALIEMFSAFYSISLCNVDLPSPSPEILEKIANKLKPGYFLTSAIYKAFLTARDLQITSTGNVKSLLDCTLLTPTAMHGLALISYCYRAANQSDCQTIEEFFGKVRSVYTSFSIRRVSEFIQLYTKSAGDFKDKNWFYWARIIDCQCFSKLGFHDNKMLGGICAYIIEGGITGRTWNTFWLKERIDRSEKNTIQNLCRHISRKAGSSSIERPIIHPEDIFTL